MSPELIETMRVQADGSIPLLSRHLARLQASCTALGFVWPGVPNLERDAYEAISMLGTTGVHRLRLLLDRSGKRTIQAAPLPPLLGAQHVMLSDTVLDADEPLLRFKTTYRPWYAQAASWLEGHPDVFDLLYLNARGELCEGSRSNVYLLLRGVWYTPPVSVGCLPGVQRAELIEREQVHERTLTMEDLHSAQGIRISNALRGWLDVSWRVV
ncbi:aminotransferase class IV family protein [Bordetella sp. 15P40C-2]|uniref:aminotransferase class IV family protein n=1 Tax=Bordetella sp. 15P40C-2 TaxID=2572246 RepID=UPI00132980CE|nr:aminotransferase class IV family protein [Bordetella sp. 15P40C-2]MVW70084.1 aminotransferase [Bordetella sp. 15P40C-2]